ncbi:MAG: diguanylate cyclase [candidate division WOR-3 bacterium]|nr:MAG: diguanylate cyclase [candidate division WOR-3 bacterium]
MTREDTTIEILLIESDHLDAAMVKEMLTGSLTIPFVLEHVDQLNTAMEYLAGKKSDIVLLNLFLSDSQGIDTFSTLHAHSPDIPVIVILTKKTDESYGVKAHQLGALSYILLDDTNSTLFNRAIQCAVEQHRVSVELRALSLIDDQTGLYNQHAFYVLGQHYLKLAERTRRGLIHFVIQCNNLNWIKQNIGEDEEKNALSYTACAIKETFRRSDILARLRHNKFAVIALESKKSSIDSIAQRLLKIIETYNNKTRSAYTLSIEYGSAYYDAQGPHSIADLMSRACKDMYNKRRGNG